MAEIDINPKSEHLEFATKIADDIFNRFDPDEQNDVIHQIKIRIRERRTEILELNLKQYEHLKSSLERLT